MEWHINSWLNVSTYLTCVSMCLQPLKLYVSQATVLFKQNLATCACLCVCAMCVCLLRTSFVKACGFKIAAFLRQCGNFFCSNTWTELLENDLERTTLMKSVRVVSIRTQNTQLLWLNAAFRCYGQILESGFDRE